MKIKFSFLVIIAFIFIFLSGYFIPAVFAAPFSGWLWGGSENGTMLTPPGSSALGWIDMSKVSVDVSGNLSGYGWSGGAGAPSVDGGVGWIDFGGNKCITDNSPDDSDIESKTGNIHRCIPIDPTKYCAASCTNPDGGSQAQVTKDPGTGAITGWARIVGMAQESFNYGNNGGWDGWIKFDPSYKDSSSNFYGWNGENTTDPPLNPVNYANGLGWMEYMPGNSLKICRDSCNSAQYPDPLLVWNINNGETISLKACYDSYAKCNNPDLLNAEDVTGSAGWTDSIPNKTDPNNAIDPNGINGNYKAVGGGKHEDVTATYSGNNATVTIYVNCVHNPSWCSDTARDQDRNATCQNAFFKDECGNYTCPGAKDCTGWRELGP